LQLEINNLPLALNIIFDVEGVRYY